VSAIAVHLALRAVVSLTVALFAGFTLAFLAIPDPTAATPLLAGVAATAVFAPVLYWWLGTARGSDTGAEM
jgi:hypothetical protein